MVFPLNKPAVLVMDYQNIILEDFLPPQEAASVIQNTALLVKTARDARIPVIYVMVGFRESYPEVSENNVVFSGIKSAGLFSLHNAKTAIHPALSPAPEEPVIVKHRIGAFSGTPLDMLLRAKGINTLVLAGVTTSGVVLSSVRQALDLDYRLVVVADCCADTHPEKHTVVMNEVIADHAAIVQVNEIATRINESNSLTLANHST